VSLRQLPLVLKQLHDLEEFLLVDLEQELLNDAALVDAAENRRELLDFPYLFDF